MKCFYKLRDKYYASSASSKRLKYIFYEVSWLQLKSPRWEIINNWITSSTLTVFFFENIFPDSKSEG